MASNENKASSANVVMLLAFTQANPPAYLKGKRRAQYLSDRAWYTGRHIDYAGRTGEYADKAAPHDETFSSLPAHGNFMDYVSRQGSFEGKGERGGYAPAGTGIFGRDGPIEGEALEKLRETLKTTESIIWHGVISPRKEVGDKMLASKEDAMAFMHANFDRFLRRTHLDPKNVEWYAGWHDDSASGIKHIQFAFFEKAPHLTARGGLAYTTRGCFKTSALANGLEQFEEYFSGHRDDVHIARDNLRKYMKEATPADVKRGLARELLALAKDLPKVRGRAGYAHAAYAPYRARIDALVQKLVREVPAVRERYEALMQRVAEREARAASVAGNMKNMKPTPPSAALREDIRVRMGNSVINMAKHFAYEDRAAENAAAWEKIRAERDYLRRETLARRMRQQQAHRRKKELRRMKRMFDSWYAGGAEFDVLEFYKDLAQRKEQSDVPEQGAGGKKYKNQ